MNGELRIKMKKRELIEILERVDDDFNIELIHTTKIKKEDLSYKGYFPFEYKHFKIKEFTDIGYSSKILILDIERKDE